MTVLSSLLATIGATMPNSWIERVRASNSSIADAARVGWVGSEVSDGNLLYLNLLSCLHILFSIDSHHKSPHLSPAAHQCYEGLRHCLTSLLRLMADNMSPTSLLCLVNEFEIRC